ncbi:hypothetical protein [Pseudooceanicola sp. MF1-13]|uniref:hypothetical protein n=1 Tax=Pseudooceanicola sp. MF1-13 TaxID=3379095 RepID=UPI0038925939
MSGTTLTPSAVKQLKAWEDLPDLTATRSYDYFANGRYSAATVQAGSRRVLEALILHPITVADGFCIKSQISKLRKIGFEIATVMQCRTDGSRYAVYVMNCWATRTGTLTK